MEVAQTSSAPARGLRGVIPNPGPMSMDASRTSPIDVWHQGVGPTSFESSWLQGGVKTLSSSSHFFHFYVVLLVQQEPASGHCLQLVLLPCGGAFGLDGKLLSHGIHINTRTQSFPAEHCTLKKMMFSTSPIRPNVLGNLCGVNVHETF